MQHKEGAGEMGRGILVFVVVVWGNALGVCPAQPAQSILSLESKDWNGHTYFMKSENSVVVEIGI